MTSSHSPSLLTAIVLLLYIWPLASSRHVHNRGLHKHHARQLVVPKLTAAKPSSTAASAASFIAGDAAIADIESIQEGLFDPPNDLLAFVQALEHRMEEMEALLQSSISGSSVLTSSSLSPPEPVEPTGTATTPVPDFTGLSISLNGPFETTLSTARATRSSKASSSTENFTITRTSHITRTHTVVPAIVTASSGFLPANGTHQTPVYPYASGSGLPMRPLA